jgi:hypothetical protein
VKDVISTRLILPVSCGLLLPDYICAFGDASSSGEANPPRTV